MAKIKSNQSGKNSFLQPEGRPAKKDSYIFNYEEGYKICIFFRADDVAGLTKNLKQLLDIFISSKVPIHLSIIPKKLTRACRDFINGKIIKQKGLIEIGQHGFIHKDHSGGKNHSKRYEFGPRRTYLQQLKEMREGKIILENYFKEKINVFTPPWHGYDKVTLKSIAEAGIPIVSIDHKNNFVDTGSDIAAVRVNVNFNKRDKNGNWFIENNKEILNKIFSSRSQVMGILLHHDRFSGPKDFILLKNLISVLKNSGCIEFIPLSKSPILCDNRKHNERMAMLYYLVYQFVPKPLTIMKGLTNNVHRDYDYSYITNPAILRGREAAVCKKLYDRLKKVIKEHLPREDKPVGVLLSGGLDSAAILYTLRDLTDRKIYTITGAYDGGAANLALANQLAKQFKTIHDSLIVKPADLKRIDEIYNNGYIPQPIGDDGLLSSYLMIKKLKESCSVVFSGDGADCLFSGLKMHLMNLHKKNTRGRNDEFEHYKFGEIFLNKQELKTFFGQESKAMDLAAPLKAVCSKILTKDVLKRQVLIDLNFLVKNRVDYLIYASRICKVKLILPFLDKDFVGFAVRIPSSYLAKGKHRKYILKRAFQDKLPEAVLNKTKEGFSPPFSLWYEANKEFVMRRLIRGIKLGIPKDYIKYLIALMPKSTYRDTGMKIWLMLNLMSWYSSINNKSRTGAGSHEFSDT